MSTPNDGNSKTGALGFFKGTQPLKYSFWFVYFIPALILMTVAAVFRLPGAGRGGREMALRLLVFISITAATRIIGWISVIACRKNTQRPPITVVALIVVIIDIIHKLSYWPFVIIMSIDKLTG